MPRYVVPYEGHRYLVTSATELTDAELLARVESDLATGADVDSPIVPDAVEEFARAHPGVTRAAAMGLRVAGPVVGGALGTLASPGFGTVAGGAAGAALANPMSQELERVAGLRERFSPGELAADVALGAIPGARIGRDLGVGTRVGLRAWQGARYGLGQRLIETAVDRGELPHPAEALEAAAVGGATGGLLEAGAAGIRRAAGWLRTVPRAGAPAPPAATTAAPGAPGAGVQAPAAAGQAPGPTPAAPGPSAEVFPPRAAGETTPAGFQIAPGATGPVTRPLPPERIPGVVGRFARDDAEAVALTTQLEDLRPELERRSRGEVPVAEVERFAAALTPPEAPLPVSQALNAEEITSLYVTAKAARDRLTAARVAAATDPSDPALAAAATKALDDYHGLLTTFTAARAESGRALGIQASFDEREPVTLAVRTMRAMRGLSQAGLLRTASPAEEEALIKRVVGAIDDPVTALRILRDHVRRPFGEKARDWVYFAYLSRPATHVRNILGNLEGMVEQTAGKALAVGAGEPGVVAGELGRPTVVGARIGFLRGARRGLEILRDGVTSEDLADPGFLFRFMRGDSPTELVSHMRGISLPGDPLGKRLRTGVTHVVSRALGGEDAFFRTLFEEMTAHQGAYARADRAARAEGLTGRALATRRRILAADLLASMTPKTELGREVALAGSRAVYQETPGPIARQLMAMPPVVRLTLLPFVRTPANLLRRAIQKLPGVGSLSALREVERQTSASGIARTTAAERLRSQLVGETALGYVALLPLVGLAAERVLIGEPPTDQQARARFYEQGLQGNSAVVGDRLIPLGAFGPAGIAAQSVASAVQAFERDRDASSYLDRMATAAVAAGASVRDVSFLTSIGELFDTAQGDVLKSASRIAGRKVAGMAIPGVVQDVERVLDPTIRRSPDAEGAAVAVDEVLSRVPGLSPRVPARLGSRGEPRQEALGATPGARILSVVTGTKQRTPDSALAELDRLELTRPPAGSGPRFALGGTLGTVVLSGTSRHAYEAALGQARARAMQAVMDAPAYATWSDAQRRQELARVKARVTRDLQRRAAPLVRARAQGERGALTVEDFQQ